MAQMTDWRRLTPFLMLGLLVFGEACHRREKNPQLVLDLQLARRKWYVGENPWYLLQVKNVGHASFVLNDPAWFDQHRLLSSLKDVHTRFEITGPDGKRVVQRRPWGLHGELDFWTNDCGNGTQCAPQKTVALGPGDSFAATPSMVAPVRAGCRALEPCDFRSAPGLLASLPSEQRASAASRLRLAAESIYLMGNPRFKTDSEKAKLATPRGFRILEGFDLAQPGRYQVKAVYDDGCDIGSRCENRIRTASNIVEVEVVPSPRQHEGPATHARMPSKDDLRKDPLYRAVEALQR